MNSRTRQASRDSSFNSLLKVLSPVQSRSEPIRPEFELVAYKIEVLFGLEVHQPTQLLTHYLLVPVYVGDKPGGIWLSPTSRLGTGGFLNPCVWPSISPPLVSR